jgi:hypothetical protein
MGCPGIWPVAPGGGGIWTGPPRLAPSPVESWTAAGGEGGMGGTGPVPGILAGLGGKTPGGAV